MIVISHDIMALVMITRRNGCIDRIIPVNDDLMVPGQIYCHINLQHFPDTKSTELTHINRSTHPAIFITYMYDPQQTLHFTNHGKW